jgi:aromatic ring-opening dioxygenase catalytic subunit (LigB family)
MSGSHMPAVLFGHGNPMNAIQENAWTRSWAAIGAPELAARVAQSARAGNSPSLVQSGEAALRRP